MVLAAIYVVGGWLGVLTMFPKFPKLGEQAIPLFLPPAGIGLAAILLFGYRFWPGVAIGAAVYCFVSDSDRTTDIAKTDIYIVLGTAIGNTIGAVTCAFLL